MDTYNWDVLVTYHWDIVVCFIWDLFETSWIRTDRTLSLRLLETSSWCSNKTSSRCATETFWVFHLGRTCDVVGMYRETSWGPRHDVLLPGGYWVCQVSWFSLFLRSFSLTVSLNCDNPNTLSLFQNINSRVLS